MTTHLVVSADLAYRTYRDTGIAVLQAGAARIDCGFVDAAAAGLSGAPAPEVLAEFLATLCEEIGATVLLLDGPQAWKTRITGWSTRGCANVLCTRRPRRAYQGW